MNKKIKILIAIMIIALTIIITITSSPKIKESRIKSSIQEANYCEVDSDCVDVGGKCPFGCYIYVNKNETEKISKLINSYESECIYDCLYCPSVSCENNKCKEICE